jgi:hypothetical protein
MSITRALRILDLAPEELTEAKLKARYRDLVKKVHPDAGGTMAAFIEVKTAYDMIVVAGSVTGRPRVHYEPPRPPQPPPRPEPKAAPWTPGVFSEAFRRMMEEVMAAEYARGTRPFSGFPYGSYTAHRDWQRQRRRGYLFGKHLQAIISFDDAAFVMDRWNSFVHTICGHFYCPQVDASLVWPRRVRVTIHIAACPPGVSSYKRANWTPAIEALWDAHERCDL